MILTLPWRINLCCERKRNPFYKPDHCENLRFLMAIQMSAFKTKMLAYCSSSWASVRPEQQGLVDEISIIF